MQKDKLISQLEYKNKDNNYLIKNKKHLIQYLDDKFVSDHSLIDLLNITQGHDFISMFKIHCKSQKGKDENEDTIAKAFRCAFNISHLKTTKLYRDLNAYIDYSKFSLFE